MVALKSAVRAEAARHRSKDDAKLASEAANLSDIIVPEVLQERQLLTDMCGKTWLSLPQLECPSLIASTTAVDHVAGLRSLPQTQENSVNGLADAWERRHQGVPSAARNTAVKPVRYSPCRFGICVCKASVHRTIMARLVTVVKQNYLSEVMAGEVVLIWTGLLQDDDRAAQMQKATPCSADAEDPEKAFGSLEMSRKAYVHCSFSVTK